MTKPLKSRPKPIQDPIPVPPPPGEPPEPTYAESMAGLTVRERRIAEVVGMMSRGAWLSGVSDDLLAKRSNCDPSNVSRATRLAPGSLRSSQR